jgi:hypothetical protein
MKMKTRKIILLLLLIVSQYETFAQQLAIEDTKGGSSVLFANRGSLRTNISDASIKATWMNDITQNTFLYRFDLSGKNTDGIASILGGNKITPGANFSIAFGYKWAKEKGLLFKNYSTENWLMLKAGDEVSKFKLINKDTAFNQQISPTSYHAPTIALHYNLKIGGVAFWGMSAGYAYTNNYDDLDAIEFTDRITYYDSISKTTRVFEKKLSGKSGNFVQQHALSSAIDLLVLPEENGNLGVHAFYRLKAPFNHIPVHTAGMGIHLLNDDMFSRVGIVTQIDDLIKAKDGLGKVLSISLVASIPLVFKTSN